MFPINENQTGFRQLKRPSLSLQVTGTGQFDRSYKISYQFSTETTSHMIMTTTLLLWSTYVQNLKSLTPPVTHCKMQIIGWFGRGSQGHRRSLHSMHAFDIAHMSSYYEQLSVITVPFSCTHLRYSEILVENSDFNLPHPVEISSKNTRVAGLQRGCCLLSIINVKT